MPEEGRTNSHSLRIAGLSLDEIKELAGKVREIEQRDPGRTFFIWIEGFEHLGIDEALRLLKKVYPRA